MVEAFVLMQLELDKRANKKLLLQLTYSFLGLVLHLKNIDSLY